MEGPTVTRPAATQSPAAVPLSCTLCRKRKIKCDKQNPCSNCVAAQKECVPVVRARLPRGRNGGRKGINSELRNRINRLEGLVQSLNSGLLPENANLDSAPQKASTDSDTQTSTFPNPSSTKQQPFDSREATPDITKWPLGSTLWTQLAHELNDIHAVLDNEDDDDDHDEDIDSSPPSVPTDSSGTPGDLIFTSQSVVAPVVSNSDVLEYIKIFRRNVDYILKFVHLPSFEKLLTAKEPYLGHPPDSPATQALIASAFYACICSISNSHCLFAAVRSHQDDQQSWMLISLAVRIAQSLQLHREESYNRLPWGQAEVRRRTWYTLKALDYQGAMDRGSDLMIVPRGWTTKRPTHCVDSDFALDTPVISPSADTPISMVFYNIHCHSNGLLRELNWVLPGEAELPPTPMQSSWIVRQEAIARLERTFEEDVIARIPDNGIFRFACVSFTKVLLRADLMTTARYDRRLSILNGGWGAQIGPDLMFQQLEEGYDEGPDNIALICTHQSWGHLKGIVGEEPVGGCLTWTYRQLMKAARDLAIVWEGYGVGRGDTLVAFLPSCAEWALGFWVAAILELTFVPLDPMSLAVNSGREQAYPLDILRTSIVLVSNIRDAYNFDELYPDLKKSVRCKVVCHEQVDFFFRGWINFEPEETYRLRASDAGDKPHRLGPEDRAVADDHVAVILFAQESSQHRPKGCPLTVHNIRTALVNQYILPQQRYLVTCPSSSSATLETVMVAWKRGTAVVFPGVVFSAQMTLSAVELHHCTRLVCEPPQLEELINDPSRSQRHLGSLESLSVSGGVVRAGLLALGQHALQTQWASSFLTMAEGFGMLGWRSVSLTDRELDSVGTVMPGSMVKICPGVGKDGRVLSRGEEGRLHVGGDAIIQGYLGGAPDGRFYQDSYGNKWLVTDYLATMDKNGLIRLTTQLKSSEPINSDDSS
ncbi:acetyl-CoA synthetase-like protein, partial [Aureobasidium melanogenum]